MGVRTTEYGGTDWSDGEVLEAVDLNDTMKAGIIHRKLFTDATERTITSTGTWSDSGHSFTLSNGTGALLIGLRIKMDIKHTDSTATAITANIQFSGSTITDTYVVQSLMTFNGSADLIDNMATISTTESRLIIGLDSYQGTADDSGLSLFTPVSLPDATTTIKIRVKCEGAVAADGDIYVQQVEIDAMYVADFAEDA